MLFCLFLSGSSVSVLPPPVPQPPTSDSSRSSRLISSQSVDNQSTVNTIGSLIEPISAIGVKPSMSDTAVPDEAVRASLISAVEDKLKQRLKETFSTAEVSSLFAMSSFC